jgi:hypothetical protein
MEKAICLLQQIPTAFILLKKATKLFKPSSDNKVLPIIMPGFDKDSNLVVVKRCSSYKKI